MYKMFIFERLLNDINKILEFAYIKLNESLELFML